MNKPQATEIDYLKAILIKIVEIQKMMVLPKCGCCGTMAHVTRTKDGLPLCKDCVGVEA